MSSTHLPTLKDILNLADSLYYGILVSTALWGITVVQTWTYANDNRDRWFLRSLVAVLFTIDTASTILTAQMGHFYLLEQTFGGSFHSLGKEPLVMTSITMLAINLITVFIVECFFASRVFILTQRQRTLPGLIVFFAVAALVSGMFIVSDAIRTPTVEHLGAEGMKIEVALTNTFSVASDILATVTMSWKLYTSRGAIRKTNNIVERLFAYVVARGGLVTVTQIVTLVLYVAQPTTMHWMPSHLCLCKLYFITMVTILNSRPSLRAELGGIVTSFHTTSLGPPVFRRPASTITPPSLELKTLNVDTNSKNDTKSSHSTDGKQFA
ncbi:hypothetical protein C8J56DRAFT_351691 [Mycena floridula]|nr:hypothetical protein C8J56DRAFT_351691 [Mycena floridula]